MADIKVMPLKGLLAESFSYMRDNGREMTLFAVVHMMFLTAAFELIDGWHDVFFLPWLAAYYLFWCFFFRFYFKRRPYLATLKLFDTLVPSTKILAFTFLVVTALLMLPLVPPFFGVGSEWAEKYGIYLQRYMEDSRTVDGITVVIMTLTAPFVFYRPMMAWISSLIGRSGSLKSAFARTKGNYWRMTFLAALFELLFAGLEAGGQALRIGSWLSIVAGSPLVIYFNVVLAETYDYFFLEIEG